MRRSHLGALKSSVVVACSLAVGGAACVGAEPTVAMDGAARGGASNTFSGSVAGHTFTAVDAVTDSEGQIRITDFAACGHVNQHADGTDFKITFSGTATPGDFTVVKNGNATLAAGQAVTVYEAWGSTPAYGECNLVFQVNGDSGDVIVTGVSGTTISGTFDVMFGQDRVTGSFDSVLCPQLSTPDDSGAIACEGS